MFLHINDSENNFLKSNIYNIINLKLLKSNNRSFNDFINSLIILLDINITDKSTIDFLINKIDNYCEFNTSNMIDVFSTWKITTDDLKYYGFILKIILLNREFLDSNKLKELSQLLLVLKLGDDSKYVTTATQIKINNMSCNDYFIEIIELFSNIFKKEYFYQNITEMNSDLEMDSYIVGYLENNFKIGYKNRKLTIDEIKDIFPDLISSYINNIDNMNTNSFINKFQTYLEQLSSFIFVGHFDQKLFITLDEYYSEWSEFINIKIIALICAIIYSNSEYIDC